MNIIITFAMLGLLTGCAAMIPGLMTDLDDAITDEAVSVTVDKAAMQKQTDVTIRVDVINKDPLITK